MNIVCGEVPFCVPLKMVNKQKISKGLIVCSYHIAYAFQSESTLSSWPECQGTRCSKQVRNLKFK